ncbi:MAG: hypothetical protein GF400_05915 [Candidatus Eisenbacteria bacterium]|nr:hypothetical protein [Candidatus Eisenbacteria bacterium]
MRFPLVICLALLILVTSSDVGASPIVGASANTLPEGEFMLDAWFLWRDFTWEYEDSEQFWSTLPTTDTRTGASLMPRLYYGLNDRLTLRIGVPLEDRYSEIFADGDPDDEPQSSSSTGFGDLVFDPKILLYEENEGDQRVSAIVGVRVPTGDVDAGLSDGSTDVVVGAAATQRSGDVAAHLCVTHWFNGTDDTGFDVRDQWIGTLTLETKVDEGWTLLWEAKAYASSQSSTYRRVYACPGLMWSGDRMSIGLSAMVSAYRRGGLGYSTHDFDWAPFVRIYYRFF